MIRDVRVTGLGVVAASGTGVAALAAALASGVAPRAPLPFPAAGFPHQQGGVGPARSELLGLLTRRKDLKLMTPDALLALAAGVLAWRDAGLAEGSLPDEEVGLFLGVGAEKGEIPDLAPAVALSTTDGELDLELLTSRGLDRINPLGALKTLPNMALAHLAIRLQVRGPCGTFCGSPDAGEQAIAEAHAAVARGECQAALAGGSDCLVSMAGYVQAWRGGDLPATVDPGEAAAILLLEPAAAVRARGGRPYASPPVPVCRDLLEGAVGRCGVATGPLARAVGHFLAGRQDP